MAYEWPDDAGSVTELADDDQFMVSDGGTSPLKKVSALVAADYFGGSGGAPSGSAGGDLAGTYPNPTIATGVIVNADVNASAAIALSKLATDPLARANHTGTQDASTIGAGTVATARLGSGTASSSTFLRGDQTWATPAGGSGGHPFVVVAADNAPASWAAIADYTCDGTADQTEINSAITAVNTAGGGTVLLSPGLFYITAAVAMKSYVHLRGDSMRSTYLFANVGSSYTSIDAAGTGGVIEMANRKQTMTRVSDMTINGASYQKCIYDYTEATTQTGSDTNTGALASWDAADAVHYYHDLYLTYPKDAGMHLQNFRCAVVDRCRFFDHGSGPSNTDGFHFQGVVDSFMSNLDCGAAYTGHAFNVGTVNSRFTGCKGWFAGKCGWLVSGTRNQFAACEAQDNTQYGFQITGADNTFASCQADSNSYVPGSGSGTAVTYAGWKVSASRTFLMACSGYDKNEGSRGLRQTYGFDIDSGVTGSMVHGRAHSNATSGYRDNSTGNSNDYVILGSHFLRKVASTAE